MTNSAKISKWLGFQIGDLIWIAGDKRRIGVVTKKDIYSPMLLVYFLDPIYGQAWYHEDMLRRIDHV